MIASTLITLHFSRGVQRAGPSTFKHPLCGSLFFYLLTPSSAFDLLLSSPRPALRSGGRQATDRQKLKHRLQKHNPHAHSCSRTTPSTPSPDTPA
ncbi:hypothetical protein PENSPDRAFT_464179 [Peniophora sp. CONT]|nr:hypothetical protein PENSPDRAFT_464179 [Peniophora sp. CONT]